MEFIDLRSDTLTQPTLAMRKAMMEAELGDDGRVGSQGKGEDPTLNKLEAMAADILGKERALFMPSGTMGNLTALMTHCKRGNPVVVGEHAHVLISEKGPFMPELYGLVPIKVPDPAGKLDLAFLEKALKENSARLVCVENTHNFSGGAVIPLEYLHKIRTLVRAHGLPLHMDGARIFNAAVASGVEAKTIAATADSVQFCLSKGLSSPVGSMIVGTEKFILAAREWRKILGGQMRQAGVLAAAGIESLQNLVGRLAEDHQKAKALATALEKEGIFMGEKVQTNMVKLDVSVLKLSSKDFQTELTKRGVKVHTLSPTEVRLVTHKDVSEQDCLAAARIISQFWKKRLPRS